VATAVVMASHARLGAKSLLRTLLVELEPQLVQLIVLDGALRGARGAAAQESYARELCVSFLQLGCCPNPDGYFAKESPDEVFVRGRRHVFTELVEVREGDTVDPRTTHVGDCCQVWH